MNIDNLNFNELWSGKTAEQPSSKDLIVKIDSYKKSGRKKIVFANVTLAATSLFIIFVWYYYQPQLVTTKIGIVFIIAAMAIFILASSKSLALLKPENETESNQQYLKNLIALKERQEFIQTTLLHLYFILLSAGIALYMYEYTSRMTVFWAFVTYAITAVWILFNWFYIRPKQIKKEQKKLLELIGKLESFQDQMNEE
jgi:hypothetical protein